MSLDGFANLDTVETSMAAYQYDDEEPEQQQMVVVEEVQDTVPPVVQVRPGEVRYLAAHRHAVHAPLECQSQSGHVICRGALPCHPEPLMQHMKYGIILGMFLLPIHRTLKLQVPGAQISNVYIIVTTGISETAGLRTEWPLGLPFQDFGAVAFDDVDGEVQV